MFKKKSNQLLVFLSGLGLILAIIQLLPIQGSRATSEAYGFSSSNGPTDFNVFVNLSKKIVPSVVNISTLTTLKGGYGLNGQDEILRRFFGELFQQYPGRGRGGEIEEEEGMPPYSIPGKNPRLPKSMSLGTGFVIDSSGLILTNNHVVADADEIKITFTESKDEKPTDAEVVGRDPELDVALIKVSSKREITPVALGDSDALEVGEYVMAVGNPFGQGHSVTHGIISAKGRIAPDFPLANYLQTDAPINPGNSGGPLVNLKGEVIAINNAIDQRAHGIGFAIPINVVKSVLPQLKAKGAVSRGFIGVLVGQLNAEIAKKMGVPSDLEAPFVTHVYPTEPADRAGIKPYDVILEFNGKPIHNSNELVSAVTALEVGAVVPIQISRAGKKMSFSISVGQRPGGPQNPSSPKKGKKGQSTPAPVETGMKIEDMTPELAQEFGVSEKVAGVIVTHISYGGPADRAGLSRGDVILEVDRKSIKNVGGFYSVVKSKQSYLLRVRHADGQGQERFSVIVLDLKGAKKE
jgi:serine protease Do